MSSIPSNLARVPNMLSSQIMLGSITRSNLGLLDAQVQLSSQLRINRPSDDAIGTSAVSILDDVIERRDQRLRNLSHGESVLNNVDAALGDLSSLLIEAKGIASSQIGVGSDEQTRANQAGVIESLLLEAVNISNRQYQDLYLFAGNATANQPIEDLIGGLRYQGQGEGLSSDLGLSRAIAITANGEDAFGALSSRVEGAHDLDPWIDADTRLVDLNGARGLGISLGAINVDVNGTDITVDLTEADTVGDVAQLLQDAIQTIDPVATVQIDPLLNNGLQINPAAGPITISDQAVPATAADLGLAGTYPVGGATGGDLDARLTERTLLSNISAWPAPPGSIRISNMGQSRDLDLSSAETVQDVMNLVEGLNLGVRVEIAESGDRLNFVNELSGGDMSIGEAGGTVATDLGVRSYDSGTLLADFNDGRGVEIVSGSVDPVTGTPDPAADVDFAVNLRDGGTLEIDLAGATTVQDVLDTINAAAAAAGYAVGTDFEARLVSVGNGIELVDNTGPLANPMSVEDRNGSNAAADLGLLGEASGANLASEDRATVAVDSLFTHLMALRDALRGNDERGITLAGEQLEADIARVAEARADVGVRTRRIADAAVREEDLRTQDMGLRSEVRDLDYTEAILRFNMLQQQLQAGLATAGQISRLSLLDFLS
jgi:flagellar hook-associated protein 3 FlgL